MTPEAIALLLTGAYLGASILGLLWLVDRARREAAEEAEAQRVADMQRLALARQVDEVFEEAGLE